MTDIIDLEYVADYGSVDDCPICGEPIEHGQTRATITTTSHGNTTAWTHDHCAEDETTNKAQS